MALYDYYCEANDRTVEVRHGMSESVKTWGELCEMAGIDAGDTPADAPLRKLMGAPVPMTGNASMPPALANTRWMRRASGGKS